MCLVFRMNKTGLKVLKKLWNCSCRVSVIDGRIFRDFHAKLGYHPPK